MLAMRKIITSTIMVISIVVSNMYGNCRRIYEGRVNLTR